METHLRGIGLGLIPMCIPGEWAEREGIETSYPTGFSSRAVSIDYFHSLVLPFWLIGCCVCLFFGLLILILFWLFWTYIWNIQCRWCLYVYCVVCYHLIPTTYWYAILLSSFTAVNYYAHTYLSFTILLGNNGQMLHFGATWTIPAYEIMRPFTII